MANDGEGIHKHEGAIIFLVVVLGTAGIVIGWQEYDSYPTNQEAANNLCLQGGGSCSPLYSMNDNFYIKGPYNETTVIIPANCNPVSCRITTSNLTVNHPERLLMVYRTPVTTYAELDTLTSTGLWDEVMHSPEGLSGFVLSSVVCNFGPYRYCFSSGANNSQYAFAVDIQVVSVKFTGTCG